MFFNSSSDQSGVSGVSELAVLTNLVVSNFVAHQAKKFYVAMFVKAAWG